MSDKKLSQLDPLSLPTPLTTFWAMADSKDYKVTFGTLAANMPNLRTSGLLTVGVSDIVELAAEAPTSKTSIRLNLSQGDEYNLPAGLPGDVKIFISESLEQQIILLNGLGFTQLTLNALGSTVTVMYTGEAWAVLSAYNTSLT